jgi:transposase
VERLALRPAESSERSEVLALRGNQGDRAYDAQSHRDALLRRGIQTQLAKRRTDHGSGLGRTRWVVERTIAWLHRFRRLTVRYERRPCVQEAFLTLACALVCRYFLRPNG